MPQHTPDQTDRCSRARDAGPMALGAGSARACEPPVTAVPVERVHLHAQNHAMAQRAVARDAGPKSVPCTAVARYSFRLQTDIMSAGPSLVTEVRHGSRRSAEAAVRRLPEA